MHILLPFVISSYIDLGYYDWLPQYQQQCSDSNQSVHVITIIHVTHTITPGGIEKRKGTPPKGDARTALGVGTSIKDVVDDEETEKA
jgi:hypothetical protein